LKIERRKIFRHQVPNDMFYILSNDSEIKGWIKDISEGGMAFVYIPYENYKPIQKVRLILAGYKIPFYLPDIPCKIIYDI
jgi:c-di-GMP-binding flagellar brake protein YcgR